MKPEKQVETFITEMVDSLVMWELLVFLWNNPGIADNAHGISGRLGRRSQDLHTPLETLAHHGVLKKWGTKADPVYAYHPTPKIAKSLEQFIAFNNSKEGKLIIWSQLLKRGAR